jgi:hypothetical protein
MEFDDHYVTCSLKHTIGHWLWCAVPSLNQNYVLPQVIVRSYFSFSMVSANTHYPWVIPNVMYVSHTVANVLIPSVKRLNRSTKVVRIFNDQDEIRTGYISNENHKRYHPHLYVNIFTSVHISYVF